MVSSNESSVLFSLRELMTLEEQRIRDERSAEARRLARASEAAREDDAQRRREEEARRQVEQSRLVAEAERARAEAARLDAIREGELLRVSREAAGALQIATLRAAQEHEERLVALRRGADRRRLVGLTLGMGAVFVSVVVAVGLDAYHRKAALAVEVAHAEQASLEQAALTAQLEGALARQAEEVTQLRQAATETHASPPSVASPHAPLRPAPPPTRTSAPRSTGVAAPPKSPARSCANDPDPLCGLPATTSTR